MKQTLLLAFPCALTLSFACEKSDSQEPNGQPPAGLGGGDGDFIVEPGDGDGDGDGRGDGDGDGDDIPPTIALCTFDGVETVGDPAGSLLIDDFDDGDAWVTGNGRHGRWFDYDDGTSTQTPRTTDPEGWLPQPGGLSADGYALHAVGGGYTGWGSGQVVSPAWDEEAEFNCLYDASAFDGISFWIRGSVMDETGDVATSAQNTVRFGIGSLDIFPLDAGGACTGETGQCWDWHKMRVTPTDCWRRHSFRFDELTQEGWGAPVGELDPSQMIDINFEVAHGQSYDFWIDELSFFVGQTPPEEEICDGGMGGAGGSGN